MLHVYMYNSISRYIMDMCAYTVFWSAGLACSCLVNYTCLLHVYCTIQLSVILWTCAYVIELINSFDTCLVISLIGLSIHAVTRSD